ncbi:MAG: hypothetical protein NZ898_16295, partial [Myxococcota bacterium]|nr:hypothetical protein [Myxococcota bacterium]
MTKLAGCGGKSPRPADGGADGGLEAGPIDGSVDARPRECTGISPPCSSLPLDRCHEIRGCRPTRCRGYALACERRNEAECTGTTGCTWDPAARRCSGTPVPCPGLGEEACMEQTGCVLRATEECGGDPTPCEALS